MKNVAQTNTMACRMMLVALLACGAGPAVRATTYLWNVASGPYVTGTNWTPGGGPPTALDDALIRNGGTATIGTSEAGLALNLQIGTRNTYPDSTGGSGTVTMTDGTLGVTNLYVGYRRTGTVTQSGGTVSATTFTMGNTQHAGYDYTGYGYYTLSGTGALQVTNDSIIGNENGSEFAMNGGTFASRDLIFTNSAGGQGGFTAKLTQSNGTVTVNRDLYLGKNSAQNMYQRYEISNGQLNVTGNFYAPWWGSLGSTIQQSGGAVTVGGFLRLGSNQANWSEGQAGAGYYNLSNGGSLAVTWELDVGWVTHSSFTNTGGTVTVGALYVARIAEGGAIYAEPSDYTQSLGSTTVNGVTSVGGEQYSGPQMVGNLNLNGGTFGGRALNVGYSGRGNLNNGGATTHFTGNAIVGVQQHPGTNSVGNGQITVSSGSLDIDGTLVLAQDPTTKGRVSVSGGSLNVDGSVTDGSGAEALIEVVGSAGTINLNSFTFNSPAARLLFAPDTGGISTITVTNGVALSNLLVEIDQRNTGWGGGRLDLVSGSSLTMSGVTLLSDFPVLWSGIVNESGRFIYRIDALPEPASVLLLALAVACGLGRRARPRR